MTRKAVVLAAAILVLGLSFPANADDEPTISITLDLEVMTVTIPAIKSSTLHDKETTRMLKRAVQLARYAGCEMVQQIDNPLQCSRLLE